MGERFGHYELLKRLGVGGSGEVFLARTNCGAHVVLKRLHKHLQTDRSATERFLREASAGARLHHPNIVRVLEFGEESGVYFIVHEFIEGVELAQFQAPPLTRVAAIIADVARGLHAAHTAQDRAGRLLAIVHGDVAPRNILIGLDDVTRLIDFGLATFHGNSSALGGTAEYMAPEQALDGIVTPQTDQFSLGVIFWELLTKQRLFAGASEADVLNKVSRCQVPPTGPTIPSELASIAQRMLSREAQERFPTCGEVTELLESWSAAAELLPPSQQPGPRR